MRQVSLDRANVPQLAKNASEMALLLLLPSQLKLWGSPSFFFCLPSYISGVHHPSSSSAFPAISLGFTIFFLLLPSQPYLWGSPFWVRFWRMWPFFNPTIEVVTFRLSGWCMLGVCFVAGIHPSRIRMSRCFESVRWNACVHRLDLGLYSHPKKFWGNGDRTLANTKGKIPSTGKILHREGLIPQHCIKQDSKPKTLPTSYSAPISPLEMALRRPMDVRPH